MMNTNCFLIKVPFFVVCTPVSGSSFLLLEHSLGDNRQSENLVGSDPSSKTGQVIISAEQREPI